MIPLYLAQSLDELEEHAKFPDNFRNILNDAQACNDLCKRAFDEIENKKTTKDEELAYVLCRQLETFLPQALEIATNGTTNCDPNGQKWEAILSNHLRTVKEKCAPLRIRLKAGYDECIAKRNDSRRFIRALFSDQQPITDQPFKNRSEKMPSTALEQNQERFLYKSEMQSAARADSSPTHGLTDLAIAGLKDRVPDQKVDTYLGSSIADLECYAFEDRRTYWRFSNVTACIAMGQRFLDAIDIYKVQGDEEMQFVLNKLLAAYMQRSKDACHKVANGEPDPADKELFDSYIDPAQGRCKHLEGSLTSRYDEKMVLKRKALYEIPSCAAPESWCMSTKEPMHRPKLNLSLPELHASAEIAHTQQKTDFLSEGQLCILSSQPSTELHCPTEELVEQARDDVGIASQMSTGDDALDRADHTFVFNNSHPLPTNAATIVATGTDRVSATADSPTAAGAGQKTRFESPAAIGYAPLARTDSTVNIRCVSRPGISGIANRSNECYMIVILQILNSLPGFCESISEMAQQRSHPLASELAAILRRLKDGTVGNLQELKNVLGTMHNGETWASNDQQDAHEFLMHLLNMLEQSAENVPAGEADRNWPTGERRFFSMEKLEFTVRTLLRCSNCAKESLKDEAWHFFPIDVLHNADETQVIPDSFKKFTQPESVLCECGHSSTKTTDLRSLPHVLILYFKRFARRFTGELNSSLRPTSDYIKLKTAIKFPTEDLDVRPLMPRVSQGAHYGLYRLTGIVNHHGEELKSGHYTAHCRNQNDGRWYLFNDSIVTPYPVAKASAKDAYLLFYSNCSFTPTQLQRSVVDDKRPRSI